jgi:hypothetical protein
MVRAWVRTIVGASGLAALGPAALVGALAVVGLGGGVGGLSSLGQLFAGPNVPAASVAGGPRATANVLRAAPAILAPGATGAVPGATAAAGGSAAAPSGARSAPGGGGSPRADVAPPRTHTHAGSPAAAPASTLQTNTPPQPSQPGAIHTLVDPVRTVIGSVPVAGPQVGAAIKQVESTLEPPAAHGP